MTRRREINLPNSITVSRILALPFCAYALFKYGGDNSTWRTIAFVLFFLVGATDFLDGRLARSRNSVTEFGKLLDPIADKALIGTALVSLSILGILPWWVTVIILTREIVITVFRLVVIKNGVIPANRGGKVKTMLQNFAAGLYILPLGPSLHWIRELLMGAALILTIVTGIWYFIEANKK